MTTNEPNSKAAEAADAREHEVAEAARLLEELVADRERLAHLPDALRIRLQRVCGRFARPDRSERQRYRKAKRRKERDDRREHDNALLDRTRIRRQRIELVYPTPEPRQSDDDVASGGHRFLAESLRAARNCYICKADYHEVHEFYDALCPTCARFNWEKRCQTVDLRGRVALLTGGRVKIGYQTGIKLLRAGCRLIVTTRFPRDASLRYAREVDFADWQDRLDIYGLDLRHTPSVEALTTSIDRHYERLDFIISNACQTVRRPPGFYRHLMDGETLPYEVLPEAARRLLAGYEVLRERTPALGDSSSEANGNGRSPEVPVARGGPAADALGRERVGLDWAAELSQIPLIAGDGDPQMFQSGELDADLQQVDRRDINSWRLPLAAVSSVELLEVQLVNAIAPFVLNARLKPLMLRSPRLGDRPDQHIVNVSAMEGQFYRSFKTDKHPHTNMAKAALNMMTRTSAADYIADGIHMNSVDTGWITDEDPLHLTEQKRDEHGFHPPLDHVDAAARIVAPIFDGFLTGEHRWGQFLKDYVPTRW